MIRKQLEKQLGIDLGDQKAFIREQVNFKTLPWWQRSRTVPAAQLSFAA